MKLHNPYILLGLLSVFHSSVTIVGGDFIFSSWLIFFFSPLASSLTGCVCVWSILLQTFIPGDSRLLCWILYYTRPIGILSAESTILHLHLLCWWLLSYVDGSCCCISTCVPAFHFSLLVIISSKFILGSSSVGGLYSPSWTGIVSPVPDLSPTNSLILPSYCMLFPVVYAKSPITILLPC